MPPISCLVAACHRKAAHGRQLRRDRRSTKTSIEKVSHALDVCFTGRDHAYDNDPRRGCARAKFRGTRRSWRCHHRWSRRRQARCGGRRGNWRSCGKPSPAALAQPLLLAARQMLGPHLERQIAPGIQPILPLIDQLFPHADHADHGRLDVLRSASRVDAIGLEEMAYRIRWHQHGLGRRRAIRRTGHLHRLQ